MMCLVKEGHSNIKNTACRSLLAQSPRDFELTDLEQNSPAIISHKVRTLLANIIGFSELLLFKQSATDPETIEYLRYIREAGLKIEQTLGKVISTSTPRDRPASSMATVMELTASCVRAVLGKAQSASVELAVEVTPETANISLDGTILTETLTGLLLLVVERTAMGGKIGLRCSLVGQRVLFTVWRTFSAGWQAGESGRLRLDNETAESEKALILARELSKIRGGRFWVEGIIGEISNFCLLLPLQEPTPTDQQIS